MSPGELTIIPFAPALIIGSRERESPVQHIRIYRLESPIGKIRGDASQLCRCSSNERTLPSRTNFLIATLSRLICKSNFGRARAALYAVYIGMCWRKERKSDASILNRLKALASTFLCRLRVVNLRSREEPRGFLSAILYSVCKKVYTLIYIHTHIYSQERQEIITPGSRVCRIYTPIYRTVGRGGDL